MPISPGPILPRDMNMQQWAEFLSQSGVLGDRTVKSFTPTWDGFSVDPTGDISYMDFGALVVLWNDTGANIVGTSDSVTMFFTNLPEALWPDVQRSLPCYVIDDVSFEVVNLGNVNISTSGTVGFSLLSISGGGTRVLNAAAGFNNPGTKGLPTGWIIMYAK